MSYLHIPDLYRPKGQRLLLFKEGYALEKVFGTSAHVGWRAGRVCLSSGGADPGLFRQFFDEEKLAAGFTSVGRDAVTVYGEAYGGKEQGQSGRYGPQLRFIVFDVQVGEHWLAVPSMVQVAEALSLEVVPWQKVPMDLAVLDALRDSPSEVAVRRGIAGPVDREGVVLRPLIELVANDGERLIAKHKGRMHRERKTFQEILFDPAQVQILTDAEEIAQEWVTEMRLTHVLQKLAGPADIRASGAVATAMLADVLREADGEIVPSKEADRAIMRRAAELYKARLKAQGPQDGDAARLIRPGSPA